MKKLFIENDEFVKELYGMYDIEATELDCYEAIADNYGWIASQQAKNENKELTPRELGIAEKVAKRAVLDILYDLQGKGVKLRDYADEIRSYFEKENENE